VAVPPTLKEAAALLQAGRDLEVVTACERLLQSAADDPAALHLMGVALTRLARPGDAVPRLQRAAELAPQSAPIRLALGHAHRRAGDLGGACSAYQSALVLDRSNVAARFGLAETLSALGDARGAATYYGLVALANAMDFEATQRFIACLAALPRDEVTVNKPDIPQRNVLGRVAIGMCTVQPERAARARASLERALAPATPQFHIVTDARSLAEAFNRILDRVDADVVILCHDDIEALSPSLHDALAAALDGADLVGVAGAERVTGPAVLWAGHPHVHGRVSYPRGSEGFEAAPLSLRVGILAGMQALDGVFIAMTARAARELRFDAETFDGFHFYDLDFTYRAAQAGFRLAVSTELRLLHASEGNFGDTWLRYAGRFHEKFPQLGAAARASHWYGARLPSREALHAFYDRLDAEVHALAASASA
jgi:tetratricopeptide (TPR) repeat protein